MSHPEALPTTRSSSLWHLLPVLALVGAIIAAYIPTSIVLVEGPWRTEQEGHGPLIIAATLWLAWRSREKIKSATLAPAPTTGWVILLFGLVMMIIARSQDVLMIECLSLIPVISGCIVLLAGWNVLRILAFPLGLLVFAAPPPEWMLDAITVPLKVLVSDWTTQLLYNAGYPVAQNGVVIMIGSYQLMVADACAGMNSIYALCAIGLFYAYVFHRESRVRGFILLASVLPIAIAANLIRVIALVLLAYYGGIEVIGGVFHDLTGIALFVVAVALLLSFDKTLSAISAGIEKIRQTSGYLGPSK